MTTLSCKTTLYVSLVTDSNALPNIQIIIDREAREIMYLVASVRPSVSQHSHG